jgi:hypothetical protein
MTVIYKTGMAAMAAIPVLYMQASLSSKAWLL